MAIQCIVVDDEPLAVQVIEAFISKMPELQLQRSFSNPLEALAYLKQEPSVKLVFLDIQMPELTGVEFMQLLQNQVDVVIISAYDEYALDGFQYEATDYLLKPVSFERFVKAVQKVVNKQQKDNISLVQNEFIFIRTDKRIVRVNLSEILFIEALRNYVAIQTANQKILTLQNLRGIEEILPPQKFIRVHKSFITAIDKIDSVERQRIFIGAHTIPIGDTYVKQFFEAIKLG
ncbi:LytR/AlgR family response regulator transcription factor [Chitinophaga niabensis]|uniref:DNA-binding response regulator, LytR/AlgR family n=1 Tax=Chitinophaga niabensis TaxID=536979 RepID=A0A1N6DH88_9BACT|nr:LytTR family DNA-binding domain-containing protein [Chitinophaga niabensis]SIN70128.1 DNA-binding response regulator, LytR/AlgR family [Chitinophaga niabensis]